jgi:nucleoside-diphosphate-sugar epimerase
VTDPAGLVAELVRGTEGRVAVTGATGWIGSVAMDLLFEALGDDAPSRVTGYASRSRELVVADGRTVRVLPLAALAAQDPAPSTILHFGFLTRDKVASLGVDAYTSQNLAISATVLGAIEAHRPRHLVMASSGAVLSSTDRSVSDLRADPYGTLKHLDELAFQAAARRVGATCVIPRVFSVAGRRITKPELYALGSMIRMAATGGPVTVRADRPVYRSYCGVDEVVALSLWLALTGRDAVFDSCGTAVEMGELARVVAQVHALPDDAVQRTWDPSAPAESYVGDGQAMEAFAAEAGMALRPLTDLVRETSAWLSGTAADGESP